MANTDARPKISLRKRIIAGFSAAVLVGGGLVTAGVQMAQAAGIAPEVSVTKPDSYIWGEDLDLGITFTGAEGAGAQYNLSATAVLPADAHIVSTGTLGTPKVYKAGDVLPGSLVSGTCTALGLATSGANCVVPAGKQYLVFQNISDLPQGASTSHTLTVRPKAGTFPLGADFDYQVNAYTNGDERFLPVFPGSTGMNSDAARSKSSDAGLAPDSLEVNALRITKAEITHPENEVLRGVHGDNGAEYELTIEHTGEADLTNARVVDYLPAGLEYLGSCGLRDSTSDANGTQGVADEYPNAGVLNSKAVDENCLAEESIETVTLSADEVKALGLTAGVYTKVTWNVGTWLKANPGGAAQVYTGTEGTPAVTKIRYRAGVPLFENTMDFGESTPEATSLEQGANLDNNRGASTRHGEVNGENRDAKSYTNAAEATGSHGNATVSDSTTETIDAVDVRVVKSVDNSGFTQGDLARYTLDLATSEYVRATLGAEPLRIIDTMANGLCPVYGTGTALAQGFSLSLDGVAADASAWNTALGTAGVDTQCQWDGTANNSTGAGSSDALSASAALVDINFLTKTGQFASEYTLTDAAVLDGPNRAVEIVYSAHQNTTYIKNTENDGGATTSRDTFDNTVEINFKTTPIDDVMGVYSPAISEDEKETLDASWNAWDDSAATLTAGATKLSKKVLERGDVPTREALAQGTYAGSTRWVDAAQKPFGVGDQTWYRITIDPPTGADVRNPVLTDFLPAGVEFDATTLTTPGERYHDLVIVPRDGSGAPTWPSLGTCTDVNSAAKWLDTFVPRAGAGKPDAIKFADNVFTFKFGANCGLGGDDVFMPFEAKLDIYIKVTVTNPSAFGSVDLPQNLAKYQEENRDGEILFLRDDAIVEVDRTPQLQKGIRSVNGTAASKDGKTGDAFNSNIDGEEVVQGDKVEFRLDITAPYNDTTGYQVWDVLPKGIKAADVDASGYTASLVDGGVEAPLTGYTATAYDFANIPAEVLGQLKDTIKSQNRSIIVWNITGNVPGSTRGADPGNVGYVERGLTLGYTVVVPDGSTPNGGEAAQVAQNYVNDASITSYKSINNAAPDVTTPGKTTVIVDGTENVADPRTPGANENAYVFTDSNNDTSDPSNISIPEPEMEKTLISTEVGPDATAKPAGLHNLGTNNANNEIVQGEYATFEYTATVPGKTTVANGELADDGKLRFNGDEVAYVVNAATATLPAGQTLVTVTQDEAPHATSFKLNTTTGKLIFPASYTNAEITDQVFTVQLTVWVKDNDANNPSATDLRDTLELTNTASFSWTNPNDPTQRASEQDTATTTYREPQPAIAKHATPDTNVIAGGIVLYTLTASNGAGLPTLFDSVVYDCVPAGLGDVTVTLAPADTSHDVASNMCAVENENISIGAGKSGTLITWHSGDINGGLAKELKYTVQVSPGAAGSASYVNHANITGYTLPEAVGSDTDTRDRRGVRDATTTEEIKLQDAAIAKSVDKASAPIGDTLSYTIVATLPANLNFYNVSLTDTLPAGVEYVKNSARVTTVGAGMPIVADEPAQSGQTLTWIDKTAGVDIVTNANVRTITITFDAKVTDAIGASATVSNRANFAWDSADTGGTRTDKSSTADTEILNPQLAIAKDVRFAGDTTWGQQAEGNPDKTLEYQIVVTNNGNTASFNNVVVDTLPAGVVDPKGFTVNGVAIAAPNTAVVGTVNENTTVTWTLPNAIAKNGRVTLGYTAEFAPSSEHVSETNGQPANWQTNIAKVTSYESFEDGGRTYTPTGVEADAEARPLFPRVELVKSVADTTRTAYLGEPFEWILTATNNGAGAAQKVVLTDTLPENWTFTEVKSITVAGNAVAAQNPSGDAAGPLVWTFGADATAAGTVAPVLKPGESIVIRYTATPKNAEAATTPGVGASKPHVNTLSAVTTDTTNEPGNESRPHTGDPVTDEAFLREADLKLTKDAIGGTLNGAYGVDDGSWIPGATVETDKYAQPQWQITVQNHGPDTSYGPFKFTDTPTLPAGVTVDDVANWSAFYYENAADTTPTPLTLTAGANGTFTVGDRTTSLSAGATAGTAGADRIVILADVTIDSTAVGTAENVATVDGRTYEDPDNKPEGSTNPNTDDAEKPLTPVADLTIDKVVNTADPQAGQALTWGITVQNLGPAVSQSTGAKPITITDVVPAGVTGVRASSNADWVATLEDGSAIPAKGVEPGTVIKWTYTGSAMPVGFTAPLELTGTVLSGHTGEIVNTATVTPGPTVEPDEQEPNSDDVPATPGDGTSLAIAKTRVVQVNGEWVVAVDQTPVPDFVAGAKISYRIDVMNTGTADARNVRVLDTHPAELTYASYENLGSATWTRDSSGAEVYTLTNPATLVAGTTQSFVVTFDTDPGLVTDDVVNTAQAQADNVPENEWPTDEDHTGGSDRHVDLAIEKSHTVPAAGEPAVAGGSVTYQLVVTNNGPSVASAPVNVTDKLPVGFSYPEDPENATVSINGGTPVPISGSVDERLVTWSDITAKADLALTDRVVITFTANIAPDMRAQNSIVNAATVTSSPEDTETTIDNNRSTDRVDIVTSANMEIVKSVEAGPWVAGTNVTYTLDVTNAGPSAVPATVTDALPAGLTLVSMSGTDWDCSTATAGATSGECAYEGTNGLHPVGSSKITVVAKIAESAASLAQPLKNTATLNWVDSDGPHDDSDDEDITVTRVADLGIVKTALDSEGNETSRAVAGESLWYSLVVSNNGPSDAIAPIVVTDVLPEGMSFVALTSDAAQSWQAEVDANNAQLVTFTRIPAVGILNSQSAPPITFEVAVDSATPAFIADAANELTNVATIADETLTPNGDSNPSNNEDDATVTIDRQIDLGIEKTHDADRVRIGDELPFTLEVTNFGPSEASGIVITDTVPAGLDVVTEPGEVLDENGDPTGWTIDSVTFDEADGTTAVVASYAGTLAPNATASPLIITTLVTPAAYESVTNVAIVTATEPEPDPDTEHPNRTEDPVTVPPLVTLVVEKSAVGQFKVGEIGTYEIVVSNQGPTVDPGPITVTDDLPAGLSFNSAPGLPVGATVDHSRGVVVWTLTEPLAVGDEVKLTLKVNVHQAAYDLPNHEITNTVVVDSESELTPDSVLADDATVKVVPVDPLVLTGADLSAGVLTAIALMLLVGAAAYTVGRRRQRAAHAA